ncbi:NADP-dependent oxidoreductase [Sphingomonas sp. TREG-RG-20F-R18-01]|uniref:NADP-dependent oxidoreductase n=1 Tax=Sphingomonas sp. TREG-RG-20F-R18-01 TaxID=2914982 RepID=UPI001F5A9A54|nr:NADP-dependent oxidoreductase [Sphingomonas sp. TREG-RG-20F-R18-01]
MSDTDQTDLTTARAVRIEHFGGPEVIAVANIAVPELEPGEVLVRMAVASINPVDWKIAEGKYPPLGKDKLPIVLGRDLSGTVVAVGANGGDAAVGGRVCAFIDTDRGAQSTLAVLKPGEAVAVPQAVGLDVAGAVPLAAMTAWQGMFDHGGLAAGQSILIHGAAGGVGHIAVQLAKWKGARVVATASEKDLDFVRSLGADVVVDYKNERFEDVASDLDMVFDTQGGETQDRSLAVLRKGGILVSTLDPDERKAAEHGVRTVPRWHAQPDATALAQVIALIAAGSIVVTIAKRFPLEAVRDAQAYAQNEHPRGKVILTNGQA